MNSQKANGDSLIFTWSIFRMSWAQPRFALTNLWQCYLTASIKWRDAVKATMIFGGSPPWAGFEGFKMPNDSLSTSTRWETAISMCIKVDQIRVQRKNFIRNGGANGLRCFYPDHHHWGYSSLPPRLFTWSGLVFFHCEQFLTVLDFLRIVMEKVVVILEVVKKAPVILSYGSIVHDNPE